MSTILFWQLLKGEQYLGTGADRQIRNVLVDAFGEMPLTLTQENLPILEGMAYASEGNVKEGYRILIEAIEENGSILVDGHE